MRGVRIHMSLPPRTHVRKTTASETYMAAVSAKMAENDPVASRIFPVSRLARMPTKMPTVLENPRILPTELGATSVMCA